ncbi:phage portal protein [Gracilibacillus thailandensis]|uniref:Phage portal protein n=2 Tax=Gracilibacillus thailandensis TaxID=563735 RepID=A0A6N7QSX8_9BACI|nr:phage portal protein [Gracilibacillus thailandensis]
MGLIDGVKKLSEHKDISINDEMYEEIEKWKSLYKGYYEDMHKVKYHTIEKGNQTRRMQSLGMPKVVSEEMASLVFNEKCQISISDDKTKNFIDEVFKQNKFNKNFQDYLEFMFGLSGMVIKPYAQDNKVKLTFVTAECFIPLSWDNGGIFEGVFINEFRKGKKYYTHLEWHTWQGNTLIIRNTLHVSETQGELGVDITGRFEEFFPGVAIEATLPVNPDKKANSFAYFKPNIANNVDTQSPLGISIFANSIDTLRAIDTAFDSFHQEFVLGKKRIVVPAHMVKTVVDPQTGKTHRYFDANDSTYEAFDYGDMDQDTIKDIEITLRVDEHIAAINALLNLFSMQAGFSPGSFSFDGQSMKTATEVVSEQSKTFKSKKAHETVIEAGLQELIASILQIAELYGIFKAPDDYEVTVAFDDSIAEDKTAEIGRLSQELSQGIIPKKRAIMRYYGLTEEEAIDWIAEINEERATATAESVDFFGTGGGNNGTNTNQEA